MQQQVAHSEKITIMTPESVPITLELAGVGSRLVALIIDLIIMSIIMFVVTFGGAGIASGVSDETVQLILVAIYIAFYFILFFGYFILFEVKNDGQTPGKKAASIKVIRDNGQPITFAPAAIRAILFFLVDTLFFFLVGLISILLSKKNQRIGDLAAGTLVIRSRDAKRSEAITPPPPPPPPELLIGIESWDVSRVSDQTVSIVQDFLQRRNQLGSKARQELATNLTNQLRQQIHAPTASDNHERFLEQFYAAKQARSQ